MELLSEVVLQPRVTEEEVQSACEAILFDRETGWLIPPPDRILQDALHGAAYRGNTLGHPLLCPEEIAPQITRQHILDYLASLFKPERMIICGIGLPHDVLLKATENSFLKNIPSWMNEKVNPNLLDTSVSQYTGGRVVISRDLEAYHHPMPEYAHVSLGLQSASCVDDHFVTACVLQSLMGGGGSFSAGGPGKGMHTRLFTNVLNQYHWVNSAVCQNFSYLDNGVFTITGSAEPPYLQSLVEVLCASFLGMAEKIHPEELSRAKSQLKSNLLMSLESAPVLFEDVVRQVFAYDHRRPPEDWIAKIDAVKNADIHDFVHQMFQSKVSVAGFGKLGYLPSYEDISSMLVLKKRFIPSLFSFEK
jgi:mitochondrial-processing peptidase subunit alpha